MTVLRGAARRGARRGTADTATLLTPGVHVPACARLGFGKQVGMYME